MQLLSTVEYLIYLVIFILYLKLSESATIDLMEPIMAPTSSTINISTSAERFLKNESVNSESTKSSSLKHTLAECQNSMSWICLKLQLIRLLENLTVQDELRLLNGISLMKDPEANEIKTADLMAKIARNYPNDPAARLNGYILNKIYNILQTHYLRFKLIDDSIIEEARSIIETGRRDKFGKKGGMDALVAAGLMMKGTLMAIGMAGITVIAGKALIAALMALTLAAVVGLKGLTGAGGKSHTYEIVAKPIYTSSHSHSTVHEDGGYGASSYGGAYSRTLDLSLPQALRGMSKGN